MIRLVIASLFLYPVLGSPIAGGHFCDILIHPWLASLQINGYHKCVGSIISESVILTAAHCIPNSADSFIVRVGSSRTDTGGSWHKVIEKKRHENFLTVFGASINDIGLIKVSPRFSFSNTVQKIRLAEAGSTVKAGTSVTVAGWGNESLEGLTAYYKLKSTNLFIVDNRNCSKAYGDESGTVRTSNSQICAAWENNGACNGDAGAPLVDRGTQVGIATTGISCADPKYPGIYVDIAAYRDWIDRNSKRLEALH